MAAAAALRLMDRMTVHHLLLAAHITTGLAAVTVGLFPLLTRKGSRAHRFWGRLYVLCMGTLLACAWVMTAMRFSIYFLALSASATLTLFSGVRVLRRKRPDQRRDDRAKALDWGVTLAIMAIGMLTLLQVSTGQARAPAVSSALAYGALTIGGWDVWRFARPGDWPAGPDLWKYEHVAKMLGAYGAVLSAFSGNFLTALPAPWSQLWPSLLFQPLSAIWIAALILGKRRACAPA